MSDEQATSGTNVNPAAAAPALRPNGPVMDVVPPPVAAPQSAAAEPSVVAAPPEVQDIPQISDEIAEQIAADSTAPPVETPAIATPPADPDTQPPDAGDSPSELIQAEINRDEAVPAQAALKTPKTPNPARTAVIVTVIATVLLSALAVFAYISVNP